MAIVAPLVMTRKEAEEFLSRRGWSISYSPRGVIIRDSNGLRSEAADWTTAMSMAVGRKVAERDLLAEFTAATVALVEQIEGCSFTDEHEHSLEMNRAYQVLHDLMVEVTSADRVAE